MFLFLPKPIDMITLRNVCPLPLIENGFVDWIVSTGATLSSPLKSALMQRARNAAIIDMIGASEGGPFALAITAPGQSALETATFLATPSTALFDPDTWERIAPGTGRAGVLAASGPMPWGYHNDPVKSAQTFREIDGVRYTIPGDFARIDADATVHLLGRGAACINTGGEKVYPEEVEVAARSHPDIEDCVVVGVDDDRFGQTVVLVAAARPGHTIDAQQVIQYVGDQIAAYKAPRRVVVVDAVYRSPSGKADYRWALDAATAEH